MPGSARRDDRITTPVAVSPLARARISADALAATRAQKSTYAERLQRLLAAARPPLTSAELSLGLELNEREVGRFLSTSPRLQNARPDRELRALIDAVLAGALVLAVQAALPGARREVVVLDAVEARRLDRTWTLASFGAAIGLREHELEDATLWDLGAGGVSARKAAARGPVQRRRFLGRDVFPIVLGAMRLSTAGRPDDAEAVVRAALDAGIEVIDSADSYALDEDDLGHNERLLRHACAGRAVTIVTKAGLRRPGGRWVPDASPERLRSACEASLRNLGVDALDLLLLHVVDPKVPLAESVGALERLRQEGKTRAIGLCNVSIAQLHEARAMGPIAVVQVELSRLSPKNLTLVAHCEGLGIPVMAHRPLGGHARADRAADAAVVEVAGQLGTSEAQVALGWLLAAGPNVFPTVGATRVASIVDSAASVTLALSPTALGSLDRGLPPRVIGDEVVLITGPPAAGKTSRVHGYVERGYERLNRDERGGAIAGLLPPLREGLAAGRRRWVLDNTFPTRESRRAFVDAAAAAGVPVRCVSIDIGLGDALQNAALRMLERRGRLLDAAEMQADPDPNLFPPAAIHRWFQTAEAPNASEGLTVEHLPFVRRPGGTRRALLLDLDGTIRKTTTGAPYPKDPSEVLLLPGRVETLRSYADEGWLLLGVSNQSGIARGDVLSTAVVACFDRTAELLGLPLPVRWCPHESGTIRCWCRKPMPGLALQWIVEHDLDRAACLFVGDMETDRQCAEWLGVPYRDQAEFFAG